MMNDVLENRLRQGIAQLGLDISNATVAALMTYLNGLLKWNKAFNLTAVRSPEQMVIKHLLDSLSVLPYVTGKSLIDVGTGAGLPGMVIAIVKPELPVTLLDSNGKKTRFLKQMAADMKLSNVTVVNARTEEYEGQFEMVTSRAFATLSDILDWSAHLLQQENPKGRMLAMKGQRPDDEIAQLPDGFSVSKIESLTVPFLDEDRHLVIIEKQAS